MKIDRISAFFPVYNDWGTIGSLVTITDATLKEVCNDYEIILVDDGSEDQTTEVLGFLESKFDKVRVIHHEKNRGYGGALRTGISQCRFEYIFYTDSDAQYDAREIRSLISKMKEGVDVVNGYKIRREDHFYRKIIGRIYHHIANFMFKIPIRDVDCDFRLMRKSIFDVVQLESNSGVICLEMIKKITDAGFTFVEVPVHHFWRTSGKSQFFNFGRVFRVGLGLLKMWYKLVIKPALSGERRKTGVEPQKTLSK